MRQLTDTSTHTYIRAQERPPHTFTYFEKVDGCFLFGPVQVWIKLHFGRTAVWVQQIVIAPVCVNRFQVFDSCSIRSCVCIDVSASARVCLNVFMCAVVFQYAIDVCVCVCCRDLFLFFFSLSSCLWFSCFRFTSHSKWLYICPFTYAISSVFDCFGI